MLPEEGQRIARVIFGAVGTIAEGMPTEVRRGLRDAGVSPWLAQDIGDVLSLGQALLPVAGQAGKVAKGVKGAAIFERYTAKTLAGISAKRRFVESRNVITSMDLFQPQTLFTKPKVALNAPKMADHHIFPQQFKKFFEQRGINIDEFTVSVGETTHLKGLHGKGNAGMPGRWNKKWLAFIEEKPHASAKEIYQFAGKLMDEYKINHLNLHGYKK